VTIWQIYPDFEFFGILGIRILDVHCSIQMLSVNCFFVVKTHYIPEKETSELQIMSLVCFVTYSMDLNNGHPIIDHLNTWQKESIYKRNVHHSKTELNHPVFKWLKQDGSQKWSNLLITISYLWTGHLKTGLLNTYLTSNCLVFKWL
jgi:hypothetical protein